jgi:Fic family protein
MRGKMYIHQHKDWPNFTWDEGKISKTLVEIRHRQGRLTGRMEGLGFALQTEATLQTMTLEVLKSNEIEGEKLDADQVRSSIARRLGMDIAGLVPSDRHVEGVVEMAIDATQKFDAPLTEERLFGWHAALFPAGRSGIYKIVVGTWRTNEPKDPMQVVSGAMGKEKIHFEAPDAKRLPKEMKRFLEWFESDVSMDAVIKAAVAHLWFVTIHPFDDGNGRMARTIADMQLARADGMAQRFYSMSAQIKLMRKEYYDVLEKTQQGALNITAWLAWFLVCLGEALIASEDALSMVLRKSHYWEWLRTKTLNERQRLMVNKLLDGFLGKLTSSKWATIAKCSGDTALRDIQDLMEQGVLEKEQGGGRSTSYKLAVLNS